MKKSNHFKKESQNKDINENSQVKRSDSFKVKFEEDQVPILVKDDEQTDKKVKIENSQVSIKDSRTQQDNSLKNKIKVQKKEENDSDQSLSKNKIKTKDESTSIIKSQKKEESEEGEKLIQCKDKRKKQHKRRSVISDENESSVDIDLKREQQLEQNSISNINKNSQNLGDNQQNRKRKTRYSSDNEQIEEETKNHKRHKENNQFDEYLLQSKSKTIQKRIHQQKQAKPNEKEKKSELSKKKRKQKQIQSVRSLFFEDEAKEEDSEEKSEQNSDESENENGQTKKHKKSKEARECEFYTEEQLKRKTQVLDTKFIDDLANKYVSEDQEDSIKEEEEEEDLEKTDHKSSMDLCSEEEDMNENMRQMELIKQVQIRDTQNDFDMEDDEKEVARNGLLPSIRESKLWKVKCKIGQERSLVMQIMRKAVDYLNQEKPFMILTVFNCDKSSGTIFIEAHKLSHVKSIITGLSGIYHKQNIEMIPFKDMTHLLKTCSTMSQTSVELHQWVRVKNGQGIYAGDLGIVEFIEGNVKALVKLIPRIPKEAYNDSAVGLEDNQFFKKQSAFHSQIIRVSQRLFNPSLVKSQCMKKKFPPLKKSFYIWKNQMFRNGFHYKFMKINKLIITESGINNKKQQVNPTLEEVKRFQLHVQTLTDFESDQDEWDILDDETLMKTIRKNHEAMSIKFQPGDKVKLIGSQCHNILASVQSIINDQYIMVKTIENCPLELQIKAKDAIKYFEVGEQVRIISGLHAGESGIITNIVDKHAIVTLDGKSRGELKILLFNIRNKAQETEQYTKLQNHDNKSKWSSINYQAGDVIVIENYQKVGIVFQVFTDSIKVLLENNLISTVEKERVSKKIFYKKNQYKLDRDNNAITLKSLIKIQNTSVLKGKLAEVKGYYKDILFVWIKNQMLQSNGFYAIKAREVVNAGKEFVKSVQSDNFKAFDLGKQDRREKDKKICRQLVIITQGIYKGLKAKVLFADDKTAQVEIISKFQKIDILKSHLMEIKDPTQFQYAKDLIVQTMSFEDAQNRDIIDDQNMDGDKTPKTNNVEWENDLIQVQSHDFRMRETSSADQ